MNKNTVKVIHHQRRPLLERVQEMIGRVLTQTADIVANKITYSFRSYAPTYDYERSNYCLTRAVFTASEIIDTNTNKRYGKQYIFGAALAKPIVNSAAAFTVGKIPEVTSSDKGKDAQVTEINDWLESIRGKLFKVVRNCFRDGDGYLYIDPKTLKCRLISPGRVTKIIDPVTGELIGFDIESFVKNEQTNKTTRYVEELRIKGPHRVVKKYADDSKEAETIEDSKEEADDIAPLRLIPFHNEKEDDQLYGYSEYQNLYALFANYHAVLENGIKNNIYNSNAVPVFEGVKKVGEFMEKNGKLQNDGTYKIDWDADKVMVLGEGGSAKMLEGVTNAAEVQTLLNIIFWLICQSSETPEFVFGTAVQSSKASVSEQMPIAIMKAQRKQNEMQESFTELVKAYLFFAKTATTTTTKDWTVDMPFEVKFPPILDDDLKLNIEIVKVLSDQGVITDKTKALLLNVQAYVTDIDKEIKQARKELSEKNAASTAFNDAITGGDQAVQEDLNPDEEKIANTPAQ